MKRIFSPYLLDAGERFMEIILMKVVLGIHFMKWFSFIYERNAGQAPYAQGLIQRKKNLIRQDEFS